MRTQKKLESDSLLSPRLRELQQKIQDETYLNSAVERIAMVMSKILIDNQTAMTNTSEFLYTI